MRFTSQQKSGKSGSQTETGSSRGNEIKEVNIKKKNKKIIGNYTYYQQNIIGWGYTSKVYKGRTITDTKTYPYAIKKISLSNLDDLHLHLLHNQVRIVKKLKHPNIVTCVDVLFTKKNCYIIMQFCEDGALQQCINSGLSIQQKMKIISDVSSGLRYLASVGVVHRDLKPGNILKAKNGQWKIADFGFANDLEQVIKDDTISVGTPLYMAPESILSRKYSFKSDIFSFGIIVYQVLQNGELLWIEKTKKKILQSYLSVDRQKIQIPQPFNRSFLLKMLQLSPDRRPSSQKICLQNFMSNYPLAQIRNNKIQTLKFEQLLSDQQCLKLCYLLVTIYEDQNLEYLGMKGDKFKKITTSLLSHLNSITTKQNNKFQLTLQYLNVIYKQKFPIPNQYTSIDIKSKHVIVEAYDNLDKMIKILPQQNLLNVRSRNCLTNHGSQKNILARQQNNKINTFIELKDNLIALKIIFQRLINNRKQELDVLNMKKIRSEDNLQKYFKLTKFL